MHYQGARRSSPKNLGMHPKLPRRRADQHPRLNAAELAHCLLAVCDLGQPVQLMGACLGTGLVKRICLEFTGGGRYSRRGPGSQDLRAIERRPRSKRQAYRDRAQAVQHARLGHDWCCVALGVSEAELALLSHAWAGADAASFVIEVFGQAVSELWSGGTPSGPGEHAALEQLVGARITPKLPTRASIQALSHGTTTRTVSKSLPIGQSKGRAGSA